jgi:hypothetical protein
MHDVLLLKCQKEKKIELKKYTIVIYFNNILSISLQMIL